MRQAARDRSPVVRYHMPMPTVTDTLALDRCPRCGIAKPLLKRHFMLESGGTSRRHWALYSCSVCSGVILAMARARDGEMVECLPSPVSVSHTVPQRAREYLQQAQETIGQPAASIVMSASAIDAMLKKRGWSDGTLYARIDKAAEDHLITADMAKWAHQVRLDANEQRHADEAAPLPGREDAERCFTFALALAEFLFVLPARVTRGIEDSIRGHRSTSPPIQCGP